MELQKLVESFIDRASEESYWDFKQSWHSNNADLLKDITIRQKSLVLPDSMSLRKSIGLYLFAEFVECH
ncbi:hypothetical protein ADH76_22455 [Enterocloster clostridioformis]|uniref:hypothetical protein n=1 Tax=Enterocloster clostridioformis TaxID=1531 RepID=UPI00080CB0FD|nr:hypothetical protein [Enterocloster clostridioformis]ANU46345.1 hypothetical protein A4V08_11580 [Lachnoclostridium sp. YL32]NDO31205.1 hypothetical protein [Enterocloster clostridioformis]OXE65066.1 hypothetical protein ADH76_22455 [Enterocloster clostridioformis]QQQ98931.1 hypothetical protein I5Q83_23000 [Enterocloster clostridioformis]